jgi:multidrug resistance efflux pump
VWCIAVAIVVVLGVRRFHQVRVGGVVETVDATVSSQFPGTVESLSVDLLDEIDKGAVVAIMDDGLVKASFVTAEAELSRLRAELEAHERQTRLETTTGMRRFVLNEEAARLDYMDRLVELETDKIDLERQRVELNRLERLVSEGLIDKAAYDTGRLRYEALSTKVEQSAETMALSRKRREDSVDRRVEYERQTTELDVASHLRPFREAVRVQEAKLQEILEHRTRLVLKAPIAGRVTQVFARDGMTVAAGEPILALSGTRSHRVLAYLDEASVERVRLGERVEIVSPYGRKSVVSARVLKLGGGIEEVPLRLCRNALFPQWGLPVLVGDIPTDIFVPGETLQVRFLGDVPKSAAYGDSSASPTHERRLQ